MHAGRAAEVRSVGFPWAIAALIIVCVSVRSSALVLTRGPLLQNPDNDPTTMTILWWTDVAGDSVVEYGTTTALGQSVTVPAASTCEVGGAGTCHSVRLSGLQPGTRYYYQLSTNGIVLQPVSLDTYFTTLRATGDPGDLFFTVIGDWGSGASAYYDVANNQNAADPPLVLTVGDNAYQNGTQSDWDTNALPAYSVLFRRALFFPVLGNHDLNSAGASNWASSAEIRMLALPRNAPPGQEERYWALEAGDALFLGLDSNSPALTTTQRAWIEMQLAATTRKWKFVLLHHTPYSCANGIASLGSDLNVRSQWGPLFETYGVDIVFTGHDHIYERSKYWDEFLPNGSAGQDGKGTIYVMTGGGGATLDSPANVDANGPYRQPLFGSKTYCPWLAQNCPGGPSGYCSFARYQHTAVRITNNTTLTLEAVDRNNVVFDTLVIVKQDPTATRTSTPTATVTPPPSPTPTPSYTAPPSATPTNSPTISPTNSPTFTATWTSSSTPTTSASATPSQTATRTPSATWTASTSHTPTATMTFSPAASATTTPTPTPSLTASHTSTATSTRTPAFSPTFSPTLSPTPSRTPTLTRTTTPTPTPTLSPTVTSSPTASATSVPAFCSQTAPESPCALGGGAASKDCILEFVLPEPALRNRLGVPRNRVACTDGDPSCDRDGESNGVCTIPLRLCVNNRDPRSPTCFASGISIVDIRKPPSSSTDPVDVANASLLATLFGSGGFGLTVYRSGVLAEVGRAVFTLNHCSAEITLAVPLRTTARGAKSASRRMRILAAATNGALDVDSLTLSCRPPL
ncbi:MAG: hypothetical protein KatS3mg077_3298 [Candidatus Binatia bacterium]|nr:MAG: hypothetical protein KatS3mg077_3298 [Candidatus Binatia bacterium]